MRALFVLLTAALFSGCVLEEVADTDRPTSLVLRYTLIDERDENRGADVGEHCGQASVQDGQARIERSAYSGLGTVRPFLIVLPSLEGNWATLGTGGFVVKIPGDVKANIDQKPVVVAHIEWVGNATHGHAEVDGDAVNLPYTWTERNSRDDWRIEAALANGPTVVKTYDAGGPCA